MKTIKDFYSKAHLFVAAIRVLEFTKKLPPSVNDIAHCLGFSIEEANRISRRLMNVNIVEIVEGVFGTRAYVRDYLRIEDIPKEEKESRLEEELKKFQNSQKEKSQKIESFKKEQEKKKKDLFAELNKKLKKNLENKV